MNLSEAIISAIILGENLTLGEPSEWTLPSILTKDTSIKEIVMVPDLKLEPFLTYMPETGVVQYDGEAENESFIGPLSKI